MPTYPTPTTDVTNVGNAPGDGPLRAGGIALGKLPSGEDDLPSRRSAAAKRQIPALTIVRDLWAGNERLHERGQVYLPKAPREEPEDYRVRLQRAVFYNVLKNTILGLTGFIHRTPPKLGDDVPKQIVEDWENIDLAGTHGDVFARDCTADAMCAGHDAILVEYPRGDNATGTYADDLTQRPYWVPLSKDQLVSWRTTVEDGKTVLTQLVVEEVSCVPAGQYGDREQKRYRVFFRAKPPTAPAIVGWRLLEITENKTVVVIDADIYPTQDEIPVAEIVTSGRKALFESDPPFIDLAFLNLAHYRQWSDYDASIHMTCVPLLFTAGFLLKDENGKEVVIGPNTGLNSPNPEGKAQYVTHDGGALDSVRRSLEDLENRMAALGLAALATSKRAAETATAKEMDKGATDSALAVTARGVQDGLERALYFHAKYYGLDDGGSVEINTDFTDMVMDSATMTAWANLATALNIPVRVVLEALIEGGRLSEDTDLDELEAEILAEKAAADARRAEEFEMQQANQQANQKANQRPA